jgi:hypothetical protein
MGYYSYGRSPKGLDSYATLSAVTPCLRVFWLTVTITTVCRHLCDYNIKWGGII